MSTTFPTSLQDLDATRGTSGDPLSNPNHITHHTNEDDTIEALEAKVGANSSAVTTSHDYKLSGVTASDKAASLAATENLTNKNLGVGTKITVGSDATGDIWYRHSDGTVKRLAISTDGKILKLASGVPAWDTETVTSDASTTVKGIAEEATLAEIDANTAAGDTTARLFVNPSTLGKSVDTTLADDSDAKIPSQHAVKTYVDTNLGIVFKAATASATAKISNDTARSSGSGTYVKLKETKVFYAGTMRIVFDIKTGTGTEVAYGRIYVNSEAVGTERSHTGDTNYSTVATEDITVSAYDLVQIWCKNASGATTYVQNFRISYDLGAGNDYTNTSGY